MQILLKSLALVAIVAAIEGCIVYRDPPPRRRVVVYREAPPPPPASAEPAPVETEASVVWEDEEVHTVVYREYFGATDEEIVLIPHYRRYYGWTDDDIYFLWFVSRRANVSFEVCCNTYYRSCGGDYDRLIVTYNVPRASFFVAVGPGIAYPPVYARTYGCYHANTYNVTFTHAEYHALVSMKVGCEYQGHPPATFVARVQAGTPPGRVVVQSRESCGSGGRTVTGTAVVRSAPRPWTMPPAQRQTWQHEHQAKVSGREASFQTAHPEQVQKTQEREKARRESAAKAPGSPKPGGSADPDHAKSDGKAPGQAPGGHPAAPGPHDPAQPQHAQAPPAQKQDAPPPRRPPPPREEKPKGGEEKKEK